MAAILQQDLSLSAKDRLIFPLDYPTLKDAEKAVLLLKDHVGLFKVGLELFVTAGPDIFKAIAQNSRCGIFLDLKFHDIPETVRAAVRAATAHPIRFLTVHASAGPGVLRAAVEAGQGKIHILAVTVLTSINRTELKAAGWDVRSDIGRRVLRLAKQARDAGCAGVVCSGSEPRMIKEKVDRNLMAVVPGIRPEWAAVSKDDQKRTATPREAIRQGADYLVVGRPIRTAQDPAAAADRVVEEIRIALHPHRTGRRSY